MSKLLLLVSTAVLFSIHCGPTALLPQISLLSRLLQQTPILRNSSALRVQHQRTREHLRAKCSHLCCELVKTLTHCTWCLHVLLQAQPTWRIHQTSSCVLRRPRGQHTVGPVALTDQPWLGNRILKHLHLIRAESFTHGNIRCGEDMVTAGELF